ncbi:hypothetical protein GCM10010995_26940 [Cysteiniphilum litorale]|uniref:Uncharacterized protein n=1 Tax=Cysteiniphilum litorale TaxID=2056700 RepID=A0A8J3EAE2_9GAMM|nr:hypothetical protein GCM10010995_26940 [Cysteiniphilum litorale]
MQICNGFDRGFNVISRESGQTSNWSLMARTFGESILQGKANDGCMAGAPLTI